MDTGPEIKPLAVAIEQTRNVILLGQAPDNKYIVFGIIFGTIFCEISFRVFKKSEKAFADVI